VSDEPIYLEVVAELGLPLGYHDHDHDEEEDTSE
jgi:hypothetical protein